MATQTGSEVLHLRQASEKSPPPDGVQGNDAPRRLSRRTLAVSVMALAVATGGGVWIMSAPTVETTDDAYVGADATTVAPKVRGLVSAVLVRDNQAVHAGDPLVRIDAEEFDARVLGARADLADADAAIRSARAALISLSAEERLAHANVTAAGTSIRSATADAARADADRQRYDALVSTGAVAKRDADTYRSAAIGAEQTAARVAALLSVSQRQADVTKAGHATLEAALEKAQAGQLRARAALELALQDQRNSVIRAAIDGTVGNRQVRVGDYVQAGSRLLTLVPMRALYVTANYKETQTRHMQVGQPVSIEIDALDHALTGRVESLAPGSGSTFALLPYEPGTGNFTKIVQRVPVRIRFNPGQGTAPNLRPGLSVTAKVRVLP